MPVRELGGTLTFRRYLSTAMASLFVLALSASSVAGEQRGLSQSDHHALTSLLDEFSAAYEPGRLSVSNALDISKRLFDNGPDFSMVIDAYYYPTWTSREAKIPERVASSLAEADKEAHHRTLDERVLPLGPDAAVLTRVYRYSFVDHLGRRGHQDSAITCAFVRRAKQWKIVQYHGSHGQRVYDDAEGSEPR